MYTRTLSTSFCTGSSLSFSLGPAINQIKAPMTTAAEMLNMNAAIVWPMAAY